MISLAMLAVVLASGAGAAPPKDAIVIGLLAEPVTMDPPQITDLNSARVTKRIFEGLVAQELGSFFIDHGRQIIIHRKRVQGFKLHPNFDLVLSQVWLQ
jgi:ABC-type transport system substrate-binding protein